MILVISAENGAEAYVQYFVNAGCRAAWASRLATGEIVERTLATMPDLIVLDDDCDETIARLKTDRRTASIPVMELATFPAWPGRPGSCEVRFPADGPSTVPQ
jgi:hypothetical protein